MTLLSTSDETQCIITNQQQGAEAQPVPSIEVEQARTLGDRFPSTIFDENISPYKVSYVPDSYGTTWVQVTMSQERFLAECKLRDSCMKCAAFFLGLEGSKEPAPSSKKTSKRSHKGSSPSHTDTAQLPFDFS